MQPIDSALRPKRRRALLQWLAIGAAIWVVAVGMVVLDALNLSRDAGALRDELFSALGVPAKTTVQISVGPAILTTLRLSVDAIEHLPREARLALNAVDAASFGVYELQRSVSGTERAKIFTAVDRVMSYRGWTRVVGVNDGDDLVSIFAPTKSRDGTVQRLCLAVCDGRQVVVIDATANTAALVTLVGASGARLAIK